jgi:DNA polymerase-3 subunit delta'
MMAAAYENGVNFFDNAEVYASGKSEEVMGKALVIIIRAAEDLTVSAANALLKTLEEPGTNVHFILLTSRPAGLLDTVLSRSLAVRFGALPEDVLTMLLEREGIPSEVAPYAQGSLEIARGLAEPEARRIRDEFLDGLDAALDAGHAEAALRFADGRPDGRNELLALLAYVATTFAQRGREGGGIELWADRYQIVSQSIRKVEANGSPALVLESMVNQLCRA